MNKQRQQETGAAANDTPSLCVILFCHNQADYLPVHVPVLTAAAANIDQLIIVDIASNQTVETQAREQFGQAQNFTFHRYDENIGILHAMIDMLGRVQTDYVHFMAADDSVEMGFYQSFKSLALAHPGAGVFSSAYTTIAEDGSDQQPFRVAFPANEPGHLSPAQTQAAICNNDAWFAGHATIFNVAGLRRAGGFDPELEGFSDAYAIYQLALSQGTLVDPRFLAVKRLHANQEGMRLYSGAAGRELLSRVLTKMAADPDALFDSDFRHRFAGRWRYNTVILSTAVCENGLASWVPKYFSKIAAFFRYKPFDLLSVLRKRLTRSRR